MSQVAPLQAKARRTLRSEGYMALNPPWTREELVLGLETYFRARNGGLNANGPHIIALSQQLNLLPIHPAEERSQTFRNPAGVAMTLRKFQIFDPDYQGQGLRAEFGLKQQIWDELADEPAKLTALANAVREKYLLAAAEEVVEEP